MICCLKSGSRARSLVGSLVLLGVQLTLSFAVDQECPPTHRYRGGYPLLFILRFIAKMVGSLERIIIIIIVILSTHYSSIRARREDPFPTSRERGSSASERGAPPLILGLMHRKELSSLARPPAPFYLGRVSASAAALPSFLPSFPHPSFLRSFRSLRSARPPLIIQPSPSPAPSVVPRVNSPPLSAVVLLRSLSVRPSVRRTSFP